MNRQTYAHLTCPPSSSSCPLRVMDISQDALAAMQDMHAYWRWYTWLDPLHYAWTALVLNQYDGTDILYNGVTVRPSAHAELFAQMCASFPSKHATR